MIELISNILSPYILSGAAVLVAWLFGRFSGAAKERNKASNAHNKTTAKIGESNGKVAKMDDASVRDELAKWVRDKNN